MLKIAIGVKSISKTQENGYHLKADKDDALKFILYITNSEDSEENMYFAADWLKVHCVKIK